jgi:hypothetical protein
MIISLYKETKDDWCGNFKTDFHNLVCVMFTQTGPDPKNGNGEWRVCVWGNDDLGMERDFTDESLALSCFYQVIGWKYVDFKPLAKFGFVNA